MLIQFKEIVIEIINGKALLKKCGNLHIDRGQVFCPLKNRALRRWDKMCPPCTR